MDLKAVAAAVAVAVTVTATATATGFIACTKRFWHNLGAFSFMPRQCIIIPWNSSLTIITTYETGGVRPHGRHIPNETWEAEERVPNGQLEMPLPLHNIYSFLYLLLGISDGLIHHSRRVSLRMPESKWILYWQHRWHPQGTGLTLQGGSSLSHTKIRSGRRATCRRWAVRDLWSVWFCILRSTAQEMAGPTRCARMWWGTFSLLRIMSPSRFVVYTKVGMVVTVPPQCRYRAHPPLFHRHEAHATCSSLGRALNYMGKNCRCWYCSSHGEKERVSRTGWDSGTRASRQLERAADKEEFGR